MQESLKEPSILLIFKSTYLTQLKEDLTLPRQNQWQAAELIVCFCMCCSCLDIPN